MWTESFAFLNRDAKRSINKLKNDSMYEPSIQEKVDYIGVAHINMSSITVKTVKITGYEIYDNRLFNIHSIDGHTFLVSIHNATIELNE